MSVTDMRCYKGGHMSNVKELLSESVLRGIKMYSEEEFEKLPLDQKQRHYEAVIRKLVENSHDGATISMTLSLIPYFNEKTVQKYLDKLVNTNFAYKKPIGRTNIYFRNGRLLHHALSRDLVTKKKTYSFYYIKNPEERAVFIEEKKIDNLGMVTVSGGVMIATDIFDELIGRLKQVSSEIKEKEKENDYDV